MTIEDSDRDFVRRSCPNAACCTVQGGYKVYFVVGNCSVALSATFATIEEAWTDAAKGIKRKAGEVDP